MCADGGALRIVESAFGTDQQRGRSFGITECIGSGLAAFLIGEE